MSTTENINRAVRAIDALEGEALEQVAAYIYRKQNGVSTVAKLAKVEAESAGRFAEARKLRGALERIRDYPVHSEPVGSAMAMSDIAEEALQ